MIVLRILSILCLALFAACASGSEAKSGAAGAGATTGDPLRMTITDYRSGVVVELVNNAHSNRVEQYSKVSADARRKVQDDEVMAALYDYLLEQGYARMAQSGRAPALPIGTKTWSLEIEAKGSTSHIVYAPEAPPEDRQHMRDLRDAVIATYNATQSWQAVEIKDGDLPFKGTQPPAGKKP